MLQHAPEQPRTQLHTFFLHTKLQDASFVWEIETLLEAELESTE